MKNDTKNIHLCFENLFINISEDKQEENTTTMDVFAKLDTTLRAQSIRLKEV